MNIELAAIGALFGCRVRLNRKWHGSQAKIMFITEKQVYHVLAGLYRRSFFEETKLMKAIDSFAGGLLFLLRDARKTADTVGQHKVCRGLSLLPVSMKLA